MKLFGLELRRQNSAPVNEERAVMFDGDFIKFIGALGGDQKPVTLDRALEVPAVAAALTFLPNMLASLPLHGMKEGEDGPEKITGQIATLLHDAPNEETTSFDLRQLFWFSHFSEGRGLIWIERGANNDPIALWNMDAKSTQVKRQSGKKVYKFNGIEKPFPAGDVIDLPWMPKPDGLGHYSPIARGARAINDLLAAQEYSSSLYSNGGVPPLALRGKLPTTGRDAIQRAATQVGEAIRLAEQTGKLIAQIPPGYELDKLGFDPQSGQLIEAKRFGIEEIARLFGLPPVFLQDLSKGTFSNTEQQDLHLVKHRVVQLVVAFEQQMNLKLFGRRSNRRFVKHNVDGLLRGDFKSRIEGLARGVNTAIYTPNEARGLLDLGRSGQPAADMLHVQGATVPLSAGDDVDGAE